MIKIGEYNSLTVARTAEHGVYLEDERQESVLLPKRYVPKGLEIGKQLTVFVYNDSEDRPVATTETPLIELGKFAMLKAVSNSKFGTFFDWGLSKDLLVPFREQNKEMKEGYFYLIYLYLDKETKRLVGSNKISKYLDNENLTLKKDDEVDLLVWNKTDLGNRVIINEKHLGLLYANETFRTIKMGERTKGYIKQVRKDGKIDVVLEKPGYSSIEKNAQVLLQKLENNNGHLPLTDKSPPDLIAQQLGMSKKTFKKSVGALYKRRLITIEKDSIRLVD